MNADPLAKSRRWQDGGHEWWNRFLENCTDDFDTIGGGYGRAG